MLTRQVIQGHRAQEVMLELEIDSLTPLEALTKLYKLQKKAREG